MSFVSVWLQLESRERANPPNTAYSITYKQPFWYLTFSSSCAIISDSFAVTARPESGLATWRSFVTKISFNHRTLRAEGFDRDPYLFIHPTNHEVVEVMRGINTAIEVLGPAIEELIEVINIRFEQAPGQTFPSVRVKVKLKLDERWSDRKWEEDMRYDVLRTLPGATAPITPSVDEIVERFVKRVRVAIWVRSKHAKNHAKEMSNLLGPDGEV